MANYTSDYSFTIDRVSSNDFGIFVSTLQPVPHAQQRYTTGYTREPFGIPDDVFEPIDYSIDFYKFFPEDMDDSALRAFLVNGQTLQLSTYPDVCFKILTMNVTETSGTADNRRINYHLSFTLKPFRYGLDNKWISVESGDTVKNVGTWYSKPIIELTKPDGNITITINNVDYELKDLQNSGSQKLSPLDITYIDSSRHILYLGTNALIVGHDNGRLPQLDVGDNVISWTGNVESVRIRTNWREI